MPNFIVQLIKHKRYLNKRKKDDQIAKNEFYIISKIIREELDKIGNQNWNNFSEKQKDNPLVCKQFWKRVNNNKNRNSNINDNYPKLIHNNNE